MRKLIKKSLAICLVAMLVLSAFVGTFAVSAESVATVTASEVEVEAGTTEVTVPVTIKVTDGFYAAFIQVQSEFGALTAVTIPDLENAEYNVTADDYTAVDLATGKMLVMSIYGDDTRNDITEAVINCTFTADAAPAAGDYAVTVTLPEVPAADWAESAVALTPVAGKVTVKEAAPEVTTYSVVFKDADGTVLDTQTVEEGQAAVAPELPEAAADTYFAGWSADFSNITADTEVTAQYIVLKGKIAGGNVKMQIGYTVSLTDANKLVADAGVMVYNSAALPTDGAFDINTASLSQSTKATVALSGLSLKDAINETYTFLAYAELKNGTYIYTTPSSYNYYNDFCVPNLNVAKHAAGIKKILDTYYIITKNAPELYEGQATAAAESLPTVDTSVTYTAVTSSASYNNGDFESTLLSTLTGALDFRIGVTPKFEGYTGTKSETGIMVARYTDGMAVTADNMILSSKTSAFVALAGLSVKDMATSYGFVTYVKDAEGNYHYSDTCKYSYADYIAMKLNAASTKMADAQKAMLLCELYQQCEGKALYTTN